MTPQRNKQSYYVVQNKTTGMYISSYPGLYRKNDAEFPSIVISVGLELDGATERYENYVKATENMILEIEHDISEFEDDDCRDDEWRKNEHKSDIQDVANLKNAELILVYITEGVCYERKEIIA